MIRRIRKKIFDIALIFTETTILVLIWGFVIGMLRIPYPFIDGLFYCAAGILITFAVFLIHVVRNMRGGRWAAMFLQVGACFVSAYFWITYLPGAS